jgi:hypothetical protein
LSTNLYTPLYHFSYDTRTLPLWREEFCWELFLEGDSGFVEKKSDTINENPTPTEKELYSDMCQRISAGNEKKTTVGKTTDHEKKMTHQNKVLPGKIKLKKQKNDGEELDSNKDELFEKKLNLMRPLEQKKRRECMTAKMKFR